MISLLSRAYTFLVISAVFALASFPACAQVNLTGAIQFSTDPIGNATNQRWNTLGGPADSCNCWDLWLALDSNATLPVNGPSDSQAAINIPLQAGQTYTYYIFAQPNGGFSFDAINLFFDSNNSTPGISVFGALGSSVFRPNSSSTWTLAGNSVSGSGTGFYTANGVTVVLSAFNWNNPATLPGDVCQSYAFSPAPGNVLSYYGAFILQVWPAAALSFSQTGGPPGTILTLTGSGFTPGETVYIYVNRIGGPPIATTTAGANGGFAIKAAEPQVSYGPADFYAVGAGSGRLGAASFFVSAAMATAPHSGVPGATMVVRGFGFGSGETVDVYWDQPSQLLGAMTADVRGTGKLTITIPANAPTGPNGLRGVGQTTGAVGLARVQVK